MAFSWSCFSPPHKVMLTEQLEWTVLRRAEQTGEKRSPRMAPVAWLKEKTEDTVQGPHLLGVYLLFAGIWVGPSQCVQPSYRSWLFSSSSHLCFNPYHLTDLDTASRRTERNLTPSLSCFTERTEDLRWKTMCHGLRESSW